jgi:hypothetical protein
MTVKAKPILDGKFWILEDRGTRVGTLRVDENNKYIVSSAGGGVSSFSTRKSLTKEFGKDFFDVKTTISSVTETKEINGYSTSSTPYNTMYDVKRNLPLFTKSAKSKSLYCAGYYIIQFDKGWVKSHCPKLITLERYGYKGPFKSELEMRSELNRVSK